jgi:hypothetical protein
MPLWTTLNFKENGHFFYGKDQREHEHYKKKKKKPKKKKEEGNMPPNNPANNCYCYPCPPFNWPTQNQNTQNTKHDHSQKKSKGSLKKLVGFKCNADTYEKVKTLMETVHVTLKPWEPKEHAGKKTEDGKGSGHMYFAITEQQRRVFDQTLKKFPDIASAAGHAPRKTKKSSSSDAENGASSPALSVTNV